MQFFPFLNFNLHIFSPLPSARVLLKIHCWVYISTLHLFMSFIQHITSIPSIRLFLHPLIMFLNNFSWLAYTALCRLWKMLKIHSALHVRMGKIPVIQDEKIEERKKLNFKVGKNGCWVIENGTRFLKLDFYGSGVFTLELMFRCLHTSDFKSSGSFTLEYDFQVASQYSQ